MENILITIKSFLATGFVSICSKILVTALILIVGLWIVKVVMKKFKKGKLIAKVNPAARGFFCSALDVVLKGVIIISACTYVGIPMASVVAVLGSAGVAIGLALQGSLSNLAGGLMILFFKPFKIGDFIEASGESGTVVEISVVYTELLTPDNKRITVPNGTLTNSVIKNYSAEDTRRVDFTFNVAYDSNDETVKKLISEIIQAHPLSLAEPAPVVRLSAHADSSLTYSARVWCKNADYWTVYFDIMEAVKASFDKNGINIPFQQMDIHIKND